MGKQQTCTRYKTVMARSAAGTKRALRCVNFEPASSVGKHPRCPTAQAGKRLTGGKGVGRSPGLIRVVRTCSGALGPNQKSLAKLAKKARKSKKSRKSKR